MSKLPFPVLFEATQVLDQLAARKGGYYYASLPASIVKSWPKRKKTRLICSLSSTVVFSCGLNPMGNGDFFIIISRKNAQAANLTLGENFQFSVSVDPNPLGVAIPETLKVLLEQDSELATRFDALTDGKKRGIIHQLVRIKNIDLQLERAQKLIRQS